MFAISLSNPFQIDSAKEKVHLFGLDTRLFVFYFICFLFCFEHVELMENVGLLRHDLMSQAPIFLSKPNSCAKKVSFGFWFIRV